jgi:hypothetical protein
VRAKVALTRVSQEPHHLYTSPNIIRTIKQRRMKWAGYVEQRV